GVTVDDLKETLTLLLRRVIALLHKSDLRRTGRHINQIIAIPRIAVDITVVREGVSTLLATTVEKGKTCFQVAYPIAFVRHVTDDAVRHDVAVIAELSDIRIARIIHSGKIGRASCRERV